MLELQFAVDSDSSKSDSATKLAIRYILPLASRIANDAYPADTAGVFGSKLLASLVIEQDVQHGHSVTSMRLGYEWQTRSWVQVS